MRGFIGNTDFDWCRFLAAQSGVDEVNFWQPSGGGGRFVALQPGEPFFFRLKSPHNAIAGFGYFASYSALPAWLAWESFGRTNGAADFDEMRARIERYRRRSGAAGSGRPGDYSIGCIMVASPVFFPQELWVREPAGWAHIMPYADGGTHDVTNGLLLRSDIHRLFDLGYVTVTPEYRFKVSDTLAEDSHNGRTYYAERDRRARLAWGECEVCRGGAVWCCAGCRIVGQA
ncbi:MAG: HNH endonuclease [Aeromicrobium sp.]|nr:HNH endonuclease [Aeromicrobium sp.]